jgi:hypothetical protein
MRKELRDTNRTYQRKAGSRKSYERVLVVCEGEKSELNYFKEIANAYRIPTLVTVCTAQKRTEPRQIIDTAQKIIETDRKKIKKEPDFEWVYVVFDRDEHQTYQQALVEAKELDRTYRTSQKQKVRFIAIPSVPCFEFWLLLHYKYHDTRLTTAEAIKHLKKALPNYSTTMTGIFEITEKKLLQAKQHAAKLRESFKPDDGQDPYTEVDQLIEHLARIKRQSSLAP